MAVEKGSGSGSGQANWLFLFLAACAQAAHLPQIQGSGLRALTRELWALNRELWALGYGPLGSGLP